MVVFYLNVLLLSIYVTLGSLDVVFYQSNTCRFSKPFQCPVLPPNLVEEYKIDQLMKWMHEGGAYIGPVAIVTLTEGYRGVIATDELPANTTYMKIPYSLLISSEAGKKTSLGQEMTSKLHLMSDDVDVNYLVMYLLENAIDERDLSFGPYFDTLPQLSDLSSIPITWSSEEVDEFLNETSYALSDTKEYKKAFQHDYRILKEHIKGFHFSYEEYSWARLIVLSRYFALPDGGSCLIPLDDMLNHDITRYYPDQVGANTDWNLDDHDQINHVSTDVRVEAGTQLLHTYNYECNSELLMTYGFAAENNDDGRYEYNVVEFQLPVESERDPAKGFDEFRAYTLSMEVMDDASAAMYSYLRYILASPDEIPTFTDRDFDFEGLKVEALSLEHEINVLQKVRDLYHEQLDKYSTTYEQDQTMLQDLSSFPYGSKQRNSRLILAGEKKILRYHLQFTQTMIRYLRLDFQEVKHQFEKDFANERPEYRFYVSEYVDNVVLSLLDPEKL